VNRLIIYTNHPDTVLALLTANDLIDNLLNTTISMPPDRLEVPYPDDAISQSLGYWFSMTIGCGLVKNYKLRQRWESEEAQS
jgi:hypothetical protein